MDTYIVMGEALDYIYWLMGKDRVGEVHFLPTQYYADEDIDNRLKVVDCMIKNHLMEAVKMGVESL